MLEHGQTQKAFLDILSENTIKKQGKLIIFKGDYKMLQIGSMVNVKNSAPASIGLQDVRKLIQEVREGN